MKTINANIHKVVSGKNTKINVPVQSDFQTDSRWSFLGINNGVSEWCDGMHDRSTACKANVFLDSGYILDEVVKLEGTDIVACIIGIILKSKLTVKAGDEDIVEFYWEITVRVL